MSDSPTDPNLLAGILSEQTDKRVDILRRIADVGSISEAARSAGVSYKAAWQAIDTLTNLAGTPLVEKVVGGAHGGGTRLTTAGRMVLDLADELARARREVLDRFTAAAQDAPHAAAPASSLARVSAATLQTSMRNQFPAVIETMKIGSALVKLILRIDDTHLIRASVTKESAQLLSLREGMEVLALAKATAVNITADFPENSDAREENHIVGEVIRSERAARGGECSIRLPSGLVIVGFARAGHGLKLHQKAVASLPPSVIVIALAQ